MCCILQAEYTVFGQANPFIHSKYFVELLNHPRMLGKVQCMSLVSTFHAMYWFVFRD